MFFESKCEAIHQSISKIEKQICLWIFVKAIQIDLKIAIYDVFNSFILIAKQIINNLLSLKSNRLQICALKRLLSILRIAMTISLDRNMRCFEHWWFLIYWVRNNSTIIFDIAKQLCFRTLCLLKWKINYLINCKIAMCDVSHLNSFWFFMLNNRQKLRHFEKQIISKLFRKVLICWRWLILKVAHAMFFDMHLTWLCYIIVLKKIKKLIFQKKRQL